MKNEHSAACFMHNAIIFLHRPSNFWTDGRAKGWASEGSESRRHRQRRRGDPTDKKKPRWSQSRDPSDAPCKKQQGPWSYLDGLIRWVRAITDLLSASHAHTLRVCVSIKENISTRFRLCGSDKPGWEFDDAVSSVSSPHFPQCSFVAT